MRLLIKWPRTLWRIITYILHLQENYQISLVFSYHYLNKFFLHHKYAIYFKDDWSGECKQILASVSQSHRPKLIQHGLAKLEALVHFLVAFLFNNMFFVTTFNSKWQRKKYDRGRKKRKKKCLSFSSEIIFVNMRRKSKVSLFWTWGLLGTQIYSLAAIISKTVSS